MKYLGYEVKPYSEVSSVYLPVIVRNVKPVSFEIEDTLMAIEPDPGYDEADYYSKHAYYYPLKWSILKSLFDNSGKKADDAKDKDYEVIDWKGDSDDGHYYKDGHLVIFNGDVFNPDDTASVGTVFHGTFTQVSELGFPVEVDPSATSLSSLFREMYGLNKIPDLDTKNITDMSRMFEGCENLTILPLYNTSKVTNIDQMFLAYREDEKYLPEYKEGFTPDSLRELPTYDFTNVTTAQRAFAGRTGLTKLGANIDFSKIEDATKMFKLCWSLAEINTDNSIDFSSIKKAKDMFLECKALKTLNLKNVPTVDGCAFITDDAFKKYLAIPETTTVNIVSHKTLTADEARKCEFGDKSVLPAA